MTDTAKLIATLCQIADAGPDIRLMRWRDIGKACGAASIELAKVPKWQPMPNKVDTSKAPFDGKPVLVTGGRAVGEIYLDKPIEAIVAIYEDYWHSDHEDA